MNSESQKFMLKLFSWLEDRGVPNLKIPQIGGKELDLYKLYNLVIQKGGGEYVSNNKLWKEIVSEFDLPSTCTSASYTLKSNYQKYLLQYEQIHHFKKEENEMVTELEPQRIKKTQNVNKNYERPQIIDKENLLNSAEIRNNLKMALQNSYKNADLKQEIFFIKKKRLIPYTSEIRRISLSFESKLLNEIKYSLNCLLIYSCSKQAPFYIDNYKTIFDSFVNYFEYIIKKLFLNDLNKDNLNINENYTLPMIDLIENVKLNNSNDFNTFEELSWTELMDQFKIILLIIRNLIMMKINEEAIFNHRKVNELLFICFLNNFNNSEIEIYLLEIFSYITKDKTFNQISNDKKEIFINKIIEYINSDYLQEYENGIECLNNLLLNQDNEIIIEDKIDLFLDSLIKNLLSNSVHIIENTIGILYHFSDLKISTRVKLAKNKNFFSRIISLIAGNNSKSSDKIARICALIIQNVSNTPASKKYLKIYERDLFILATIDESISKILCQILYDLKNVNIDDIFDPQIWYKKKLQEVENDFINN